MRKTLFLFIAVLSIVGLEWLRGSGQQEGPPARALLEIAPPEAQETLKEACAAGCSVGSHPITPLAASEYREHLQALAQGPEDTRTKALETLLFHGPQVRELTRELGLAPLAGEPAARLRRELARTHARLWLRVVDEQGEVRAAVDGERFPIGRKEHVHASVARNLQPPEISGTIQRTGLHHLWTRI